MTMVVRLFINILRIFKKLVEKYGESNVKDKLIALDSYLANGIKKYKNHHRY